MATYKVRVGADGRVTVPDAVPGQEVVVHVTETDGHQARGLTLATARTDDERQVVVAEIKRLARALRAELGDDQVRLSSAHGRLLYNDDGLPT